MRHWLVVVILCAGCPGAAPPDPTATPDAASSGNVDAAAESDAETTNFSFFITSMSGPNGGDFRRTAADTDGLAGADEMCQARATAASR